jgi:acetylornithine deacetylase/succinyl-diaminopimelate desuccinylase-like protein
VTPVPVLDLDLLVALLELPTAGPLEVGPDAPVELWAAQKAYAAAAAGFEVVHHAAPEPPREPVPEVVRVAADAAFLAAQPSLVLRRGPASPSATVMFNVHLDTVAGLEPVRLDPDRVYGRGAIDAKGPAVALLAGIAAADLGDLAVLVQAVAGEEGGAMGVFGTRPLVDAGFTGDLNVFCEPTGGRLLDHGTAAATVAVEVAGADAIDDEPAAGHNATVLLGALAGHLARTLPAATDGQVCVAGLHTGTMHNKVYGSGRLLLNLSYGTPAAADRLAAAVDRELARGLHAFAEENRNVPLLARTARDTVAITSLRWLKRGLPPLPPADPAVLGPLAEAAALPRWPAAEPGFTCDAIWAAGHGTTVVLGPGDLGANHAHAAGEFADRAELQSYAAAVARLLGVLADRPELIRKGSG